MSYDVSGTAVIDMIGLDITGNVTPVEWYNHVKMENGKPDTNAITLLADIVYWYRPVKVRSELTGNVIRYEKRFKADKLQRSYGSFADQYGFSKDQVRFALARLVGLGIIDLDWRTVNNNGTLANNVLFIGLNVSALKEITYPCANQMAQVVESNGIGGRIDSHTNTETTTETTTQKDFPLSLFTQAVDVSQAPTTTSASSGKDRAAPKGRNSRVFTDEVENAPGSSQKEMFGALAEVCRLDTKIKRVATQVGKAASELCAAGYTVQDVTRFRDWWYASDFRGKQGQVPSLNLIPTLIPQSVAPPPLPVAPPDNQQHIDSVRSWHKTQRLGEWKSHVAAELGTYPGDAKAYLEWYESEYGNLSEAELRRLWREYRKESE